MKSWKVVAAVAIVLLPLTFAGGYFYGSYRTAKELEPQILVGEKYRVVRTPGGMLEVAKLQKQESFAWQINWVCPFGLCESLPLPKGSAQISAVVYYTYRIPLSEYWILEKVSNQPFRYRLKVPKLEPQLPVTIDLSTIRVINNGGLFSPSGPDQQKMQSYMQPQLEKHAKAATYIQAQHAEAVKTIKEFARKWMRDGDVKIPKNAEIEVVF